MKFKPLCQSRRGFFLVCCSAIVGIIPQFTGWLCPGARDLTEKKATDEGGLNARRVTGGRDLCKGLIHQQCQ
ncbi:hypothetical protein [Comamonas sp. JUb58]|uniref:hypothetical protein n=1 Tax=Comamonas sp. JUb58 TaxID=2485114 RepID=UPI0014152913|nr:hypothetical protein [Comamonas sp. JUb58]